MLRVSLLGEIRITHGGTPCGARAGASAHALLAYLVLHPGTLRREAVAYTLWPDVPEADALSRLRRFLFVLNGVLPPSETPWIDAGRRTVGWNAAAPCWVDALEFERLAADPATAVAAIDLYRGPLLPGIEDEWACDRRAALATRYAETLAALVALHRREGDARGGLLFARRLLESDPLAEDVVREVMYFRAATGDRSGALRSYREFVERAAQELGVEPMAETRMLYDRLAAPAGDAAAIRMTNLPFQATSFVGRADDVARIAGVLRGDARLVTVAGIGGIGKSRIALEVGRLLLDEFADGVWLVELSQIDDPRLIAGEVARVFGVAGRSREEVRAELVGYLTRKRVLLILDNCEHVLASVANVVDELLRTCSDVRVLATSRERLHLLAESTYRLSSLETPDRPVAGHADAMTFSSVELFARRAEALDAGRFAVTDENAQIVADIVCRTDGIPLAIELAVPWLHVLGAQGLLDRLQDRFRILARRDGQGGDRRQTLDALIRWSADSLSPAQRDVFASSSVFPGTFTLAAISSVHGVSADDLEVVASMTALVDKSLVHAAGHEERRFALLDSVREFGVREQGADELHVRRNRHAGFYLELARAADDVRRVAALDGAWERMLQRDRHNCYAALEWALNGEGDRAAGVELAVLLRRYFDYEPVALERRWLRLALERASEADVELRADAMLAYEIALRHAHRPQRVAALEDVVAVHREIGDPLKLQTALAWLGWALKAAGRQREGLTAAHEASKLARTHGSARDLAWTLRVEALVTPPECVAERRACLREALGVLEPFGPDRDAAATMSLMADVEAGAGNWDDALQHARAAFALYESRPAVQRSARIAMAIAVAGYLLVTGDLASGRDAALRAVTTSADASAQNMEGAILVAAYAHALAGDPSRAAKLGGYCAALNDLGDLVTAARACNERLAALLRTRYTEAELAAFAAEGAVWTQDRALAECDALREPAAPAEVSR